MWKPARLRRTRRTLIHIHMFLTPAIRGRFFCPLNGAFFLSFSVVFFVFFFFLPIRPVVKVNSCNLHATCSSPGQMHLHPLIIDYSTYFHCVEAERIRRSMTRCLMRDLRLCCAEKEEPCDFLAAVRITTFSLLLLKPIEEQFKFLTLCR